MSSPGPAPPPNMAAGVAREQLSDQVRSPVLTVNSSDNKTSSQVYVKYRPLDVWAGDAKNKFPGGGRSHGPPLSMAK